jgi:hypothetical protein
MIDRVMLHGVPGETSPARFGRERYAHRGSSHPLRWLCREKLHRDASAQEAQPSDRAYVFLLEAGLVTPDHIAAALADVGPHGDVAGYLVQRGVLNADVLDALVQGRVALQAAFATDR